MKNLKHTYDLDGFDFTIIGPEIEHTIEPFSYTVRLKAMPELDEETEEVTPLKTTVRCTGIPCDMCRFKEACESGEKVTEVLTEYVKENHMELFI